MRWEDERYVRLYTRDTATWKLLTWQSKCLLPVIMRKLDRAGIIELGDDGIDGLAALIDMPSEFVNEGLPDLLKRKVLVMSGATLVMPNFLKAQETRQSDGQRKRDSRERERADALRSASPEVTGGHQTTECCPPSSPTVTLCLPVPSLPNPNLTEAPAEPDVVVPSKIREPEPTPPSTILEPDSSTIPVGPSSAAFKLQRHIVNCEKNAWIAAYGRGIAKARADGKGFAFPKHKIESLVSVIETYCEGPSRSNIDGWVESEAEAFVRAVRKLEKPPANWYRFEPDALLQWWNDRCPGRPKPAPAKSPAPKQTTTGPPTEAMTPEQTAAYAEQMHRILGGGHFGQTG